MEEVRIVKQVQVEVMINLEDDLNLTLSGLPITIVASQVTRNLNVDISSKIKKIGTIKPDQINLKKKEDKSTMAMAVDGDDNVFLIGEDNYLNISCDDCLWIVDSGAFFHISPHGGFFSTYQSGDFGMVKMGNCVTSKIVGIGDITFMIDIWHKLVLKEVTHVRDMGLNLISVRKLDNVGLINHFGDCKWKLTKGNMIVAQGKKKDALYVLQGRICKGEAIVAHGDSSMELWNRRLGHMSEKG